jgi:hypothetical protein
MKYLDILDKHTNTTELAAIIGKSISTASRLINGKYKPDWQDMQNMLNRISRLRAKDFFYDRSLTRSADKVIGEQK